MSYDLASAANEPARAGLRERISAGRVSLGGWCMLPSPFAAEIISASGCDWLAIDQQHGHVDPASLRAMIQAADIRRVPVLVRVAWNDPGAIMRVLDDGAEGVIVPMVNSAEEAHQAVAAARYPPEGFRSWGPLRSALAHAGFNPASGNAQTVCLVMVETLAGIDRLDEILEVPGVDGVLVGPNDLAISRSGTTAGSERDDEMIASIVAACRSRNLVASIACSSSEDLARRRMEGFTMLGVSTDVTLLAEGMARRMADARATSSIREMQA
jgi:4-hydroxy-2-oxoheptanedioate aldolase